MRLFGIRATSMAMGLCLVAASLGVLGAGSGGPGSLKYEVAASLSARDGQVSACWASMDPDSCGVVAVRGIDISQYQNFEWSPGAPLMTPILHLVGAWDGHTLTLTEPAQPASSATPYPEPCGKLPVGFTPEPKLLALQDRVGIDRALLENRGIEVLGTSACDGTVGIIVVVADPDTVSYLRARYHTVAVAGWLQPVSGL